MTGANPCDWWLAGPEVVQILHEKYAKATKLSCHEHIKHKSCKEDDPSIALVCRSLLDFRLWIHRHFASVCAALLCNVMMISFIGIYLTYLRKPIFYHSSSEINIIALVFYEISMCIWHNKTWQNLARGSLYQLLVYYDESLVFIYALFVAFAKVFAFAHNWISRTCTWLLVPHLHLNAAISIWTKACL